EDPGTDDAPHDQGTGRQQSELTAGAILRRGRHRQLVGPDRRIGGKNPTGTTYSRPAATALAGLALLRSGDRGYVLGDGLDLGLGQRAPERGHSPTTVGDLVDDQ